MPASEGERIRELTAWGTGAYFPLRDDTHETRLAVAVAEDPETWWATARDLIRQASDRQFGDNLGVALAIILEAGGPDLVEAAGREARDDSRLAEALYDWPMVYRWRSDLYRLIGRDRLVENYFKDQEHAAWPWRMMDELTREDPNEAWLVTLALIAAAPDNDALGYVAAGPLEDLMANHGRELIDSVEVEAANNPRLRQAITMIYAWEAPDELFERLEQAAGERLLRPPGNASPPV